MGSRRQQGDICVKHFRFDILTENSALSWRLTLFILIKNYFLVLILILVVISLNDYFYSIFCSVNLFFLPLPTPSTSTQFSFPYILKIPLCLLIQLNSSGPWLIKNLQHSINNQVNIGVFPINLPNSFHLSCCHSSPHLAH